MNCNLIRTSKRPSIRAQGFHVPLCSTISSVAALAARLLGLQQAPWEGKGQDFCAHFTEGETETQRRCGLHEKHGF